MLIVFLFCLPLLPKFFLQESIPTAEPVSTESSSAGSALYHSRKKQSLRQSRNRSRWFRLSAFLQQEII